jgi:Uma2 family endonuclease
MKAVIAHVSERELAERRRTGLDRWDEMWEGVLHMAPAPNVEHQRIVRALVEWLGPLLRSTDRGALNLQINVFHERATQENYRIPDLTFVARGRESVIASDGIRGGAPDAVIEIRSPDDETYEKLAFFAALGVFEVIVVDRDTKQTSIFRLAGPQYVALQPDPDGWLGSDALGVRFRTGGDPQRAVLVVEDRHADARTEI